MKNLTRCCLTILTFICCQGALAETNLLYILDVSGSMWGQIDGTSKIETARKVLTATMRDLPAETNVGLMAYGHRKEGSCKDVEIISAVSRPNIELLVAKINKLQPLGKTPLAESIKQSVSAFSEKKGNNHVLLISDGLESCNGDPCAAASVAHNSGVGVKIHVLGFDLSDEQQKKLRCIAEQGEGQFFTANSTGDFSRAMSQAVTVVVQAPPVSKKVNLIAPKSGGALLTAPSTTWVSTNDGLEKSVAWLRKGQEAVYSFKNDEAATFDRFTVFIGSAHGNNLKEFELLAGDEGITGSFRSIGIFSTQNMKMMRAPHQAFSFAPVTARFLKIRLVSAHSNNETAIYSTEFQLFGENTPTAPATAATIEKGDIRVNLISPKNGGSLLTAPSDTWVSTNDGAEKSVAWLRKGQEGVYAFKEDKQATFNKFTVFIGSRHGNNVKKVELLVSDESPTGTFRSIGTFATQNTKLMRTPYQVFTFAPVSARYFKVRLISAHTGSETAIYSTEFQLFGNLNKSDTPLPASKIATVEKAINLLSEKNGGALLAAPNDQWLATVDGSPKAVAWLRKGQEGVYAFKGDKPATFDTFGILIPNSHGNNVKEVELLVGDESVTGTFRSIGTFTTQNLKMMRSPMQHFSFKPVTARFLKIRLPLNLEQSCCLFSKNSG